MITNKKAPAAHALIQTPCAPSFRAGRKRAHGGILVAALLVLATSTACAPRVDTRGNAVHIEDLAKIEPGVYTRDRVLNDLGSPSSRTSFGDDAWYYISERTETTAFLAPEVVERKVVVVKFDEHGVVTAVDLLDEHSAENVEPVDRKTPTAGNSLGMIEQLLSNIGRFNKNK